MESIPYRNPSISLKNIDSSRFWHVMAKITLGNFLKTRRNENLEELPYQHILQGFEFPRAFLRPVSHGKKKISKPC